MASLNSERILDYVKQRRKELDMTQRELAHSIGCSLVMIQKIEEGTRRPSKHIASLMASCLQICVAEQEEFIIFLRQTILSEVERSEKT